MDENEVKQAQPIMSLNWCASCKRETLPIGPNKLPRRSPSCGYMEQRVERLVDQIESMSL